MKTFLNKRFIQSILVTLSLYSCSKPSEISLLSPDHNSHASTLTERPLIGIYKETITAGGKNILISSNYAITTSAIKNPIHGNGSDCTELLEFALTIQIGGTVNNEDKSPEYLFKNNLTTDITINSFLHEMSKKIAVPIYIPGNEENKKIEILQIFDLIINRQEGVRIGGMRFIASIK